MVRPAPRSAGLFFALAVIAGAWIGNHYGQPSLGFVIGAGVGALICIAVWLVDRRR